MEIIIKMLDSSLDYISHELIDNTLYINVISNKHDLKCPNCGTITNKVHSRYSKSFHDLPIQGKKVIILLKNRNMFCLNENCPRYTFSERFGFIDAKAKKTKRLIEEIVHVSLTQSSISASNFLSLSTVGIKKSSICNYLKKTIKIDKEKITHICIDDFATRKRHTYGTVMIDIKTRCIIDILNSRDTQDVANWLKEYPNLKVIVRDGSISFKAAIDASHPNAIQVNDRFHILKNLVEALKKVLQKLVVGRIEIPLTSTEAKQRYKYLTELTREEKIIEAKRLRKECLSFEKIAKQLHISTTTANKYVKINITERKDTYITKRGKEHIEAINKVKCKVDRVCMLHKQGLQIKEISDITGYSASSISKYLSEDYNIVHGQYGVSRPGPLSPYRNEILTLRAQGITYEKITETLRQRGYSGSIAALRMFVSKEKRIARDLLKNKEPYELIDKKWIIKLLYKPIDKIQMLNQSQFDQVVNKYPLIGKIFEVISDFKDILIKKDSHKFKEWISNVSNLKIKELNGYIKGLKNDYDSIENAIIFDYNNGLAEGSVNKLKTIKRIMYGRNNFELLRSKVIQLESLKMISRI